MITALKSRDIGMVRYSLVVMLIISKLITLLLCSVDTLVHPDNYITILLNSKNDIVYNKNRKFIIYSWGCMRYDEPKM